MNKETHSLSLPALHPITMTDWLPKLGEKAFLAWLHFHSWKPLHFSSETGILLPYSLNKIIRMLKVGKTTFYEKIIKPLKAYGLIQVTDSEYSGQETHLLLYTYPHNQKEKAAKPLDLISPDQAVHFSNAIPNLDLIHNQHTNQNHDDPQPGYSPASGNTLSEQDPIPDQDQPSFHPVSVLNQDHPSSHPVPVLNQDQPSSHSVLVLNQDQPSSHPVLVLNQDQPSSHPVLVLNQDQPSSHPVPVLNQDHLIYKDLNNFKDLNNKDKKDKINKESSDPIHSLPEELQKTIKEDPLLEQRVYQIMIAYHKSVSHPSYTLPFFLFKLKQCVHYHHDPERFASYLYKSLLNEWNKPQAPIRIHPSSPLPRTRPHDVPEWVWRQQQEPRQPIQEISPEDKAYAEYLLRALGELES